MDHEMTCEEQAILNRQIAERAGEERTIQRIGDVRIAEMPVDFRGRKATATITIHGEWDDWFLDAVGY